MKQHKIFEKVVNKITPRAVARGAETKLIIKPEEQFC